MYGLYSRAASNQERPMMARVRYLNLPTQSFIPEHEYSVPAFLIFLSHLELSSHFGPALI